MTVEQIIAEIRRLPAQERARLRNVLDSDPGEQPHNVPEAALPNALETDSIFRRLIGAGQSLDGDVAERHDWYLGEAKLGRSNQ